MLRAAVVVIALTIIGCPQIDRWSTRRPPILARELALVPHPRSGSERCRVVHLRQEGPVGWERLSLFCLLCVDRATPCSRVSTYHYYIKCPTASLFIFTTL